MRHRLYLLAAATLFFSGSISAQTYTSKGTFDFGGDFSFSFQKRSTETELSFNIYSFNAFLGVMALKGFEIGLSPTVLGYNSSGISVTEFSLFLYPSYNFTTGSNVYPYLELAAGFGTTDDGDDNASVKGLGVNGGIKVQLRENILMLVRLQYLRQFFDFADDEKYYSQRDYNLDAITFGVGFRYVIPGKSKEQKSK